MIFEICVDHLGSILESVGGHLGAKGFSGAALGVSMPPGSKYDSQKLEGVRARGGWVGEVCTPKGRRGGGEEEVPRRLMTPRGRRISGL